MKNLQLKIDLCTDLRLQKFLKTNFTAEIMLSNVTIYSKSVINLSICGIYIIYNSLRNVTSK